VSSSPGTLLFFLASLSTLYLSFFWILYSVNQFVKAAVERIPDRQSDFMPEARKHVRPFFRDRVQNLSHSAFRS
jgi:hypothetical protein